MSIESFGATTKLPLADCPFKRSTLNVFEAEGEVARLLTESPCIIMTDPLPEVLLHPLDEEELQRDYRPERKLQALLAEVSEIQDEPRVPFVFYPHVEVEDVDWDEVHARQWHYEVKGG